MPMFKCASRARSFVTFMTLLFACNIKPALAAPQITFDIKVDPATISAGKTMDIPLYLVENRAASDTSNFVDQNLRYVRGNLRSTQSTFISFTPIAEFSKIRKVTYHDDNHQINFELDSLDPGDFSPGSGGVPVAIDNSNIIGRTEILLGTLRILIGAKIPRDDGIGDEDPPIIFSLDLGYEPPYGYSGYIKKKLSNGSHIGGISIKPNAIIIFGPDPNATPCELLQVFPEKGELCEFKLSADIKEEQPNKLFCTAGVRGVPKGKFEPVAVEVSLESGRQKAGIFSVFNEISAKTNPKGKASFNIKSVAKGSFVRCSLKGLEKDVYSNGVKVKRPNKNRR